MKTAFLLFAAAAGLVVSVNLAFAGSATWLLSPSSGDWNAPDNWTPGGPPNDTADTATFRFSTVDALSISANTQVSGIAFSTGASAYTITANPALALTISGTGIVNRSGITQNFVTAVDEHGTIGVIQFTNSSTAGALTAFTNHGSTVGELRSGGQTVFRNTATADNNTFTNNGGLVPLAGGGATVFFDNSTAGNGVFVSNSGLPGAGGGVTLFFDNSTASSGTFIAEGDSIGGGGGGSTVFLDNSTAGNGTFIAKGGAPRNPFGGASGGFTGFHDSSTAANGTFITNGAVVAGALGGFTIFGDASTAGHGTFVTNGGTYATDFATRFGGGHMFFNQNSTADHGVFYTRGGSVLNAAGGEIDFGDNSTAGHGTFTTYAGAAGAFGGVMNFYGSSTAGSGTFTNQGGLASGALGGVIEFWDDSTAGNGTFVNNGGSVRQIVTATSQTNGGIIQFISNSTAGKGIFINNGGAVSGAGGGIVIFGGSSSAANATLTTNGGATSGARGGFTEFGDESTARNATLIANGGLGGAAGGSIHLSTDSSGGMARVEVFGNGNLDISFHDAPGVTIGSIEGDGDVFLGINNLTVGSNRLSTLFSGVIQDGGIGGGTNGSLTKIGSGTLNLLGVNTYTGNTIIEEGTLIIDGSLASADTFANAHGLLGGTGIIGGNVTNSGTVSPGHSPGAFIIRGNYTQSASGTLQIEIAGRASSQHDLLAIGGSASLDGNLQLVRLANFAIPGGGRIIVLTAPEGVNGQFAVVQNPFATSDTLLTANVIYDPNDVALLFTQGSFLIGGLTRNQTAVAQNLDKVANDARAATLIGFLDSEPIGSLPQAYDLIAPEELASIYEIGFSQANVQSINLQRRMDDIRAGSNGFSAAGYQVRDTHGFTKDGDGKAILEKNPVPIMQPAPENRWGVFVTGTGEFVNVGDNDENGRGYDITTGGFTLGVDCRVSPNFAIGLDAGYARSNADLVNRGQVTVDGGKLGLYATWFSGGFYLDSAVGGGYNSYDTRRSALLANARGSTNGAEFNGLIGGGYDWKFGGWSFGPVATFQYSYVSFDGFAEDGSLAPLQFPDQSQDSKRSTLGLRARYDWKVGGGIVRQEVRAAWQHEFGDTAYPIDSRFVSGADEIFTVHGPEIGRDSALIDAGLAVLWNERVSTYVYYDGQVGRDNYTSHGVSGGLRVSF